MLLLMLATDTCSDIVKRVGPLRRRTLRRGNDPDPERMGPHPGLGLPLASGPLRMAAWMGRWAVSLQPFPFS